MNHILSKLSGILRQAPANTLITAVCAAKPERFYREIGNFIIHFGPSDRREGVICYGDEEVRNFRKDVEGDVQETSTGKEEDN